MRKLVLFIHSLQIFILSLQNTSYLMYLYLSHQIKFNDERFWLGLLESTQETKFALLPITDSRLSPQVEIRYCRLETSKVNYYTILSKMIVIFFSLLQEHYSTQSLSSSSVLQRFICSIQQEFNFRVTTALLHAISKVSDVH